MREPEETPSRVQLIGRITVSLVLLGYMFASPLIREFRVSRSRHFPEWKMFYWASTDPPACAVEFFTDDGPIDRLAALGVENPLEVKAKRRRLMGARAVFNQARQLCRGLEGEPRVLHGRAKCATMKGWKQLYDGSENLCTIQLPKEKRKKKKKNKNKNKNKGNKNAKRARAPNPGS